MITCVMPHLFKALGHMFGSNAPKKWKDIGRHLELHTSLLLWMMSVLIAFLPTVNSHRVPTNVENPDVTWIPTVNKVLIALFVLTALNGLEKVLVQ